MRLQEEVEDLLPCDSTVYTGPILWIALILHVRIICVGRIEPSMMAFTHNNDRDLGQRLRPVEVFACFSNLR